MMRSVLRVLHRFLFGDGKLETSASDESVSSERGTTVQSKTALPAKAKNGKDRESLSEAAKESPFDSTSASALREGAVQKGGSDALRVLHGLDDDMLFEQARTQWQFGDWSSLERLTLPDIEQQPQKGKLALLVATAKLQLGNTSAAEDLLRKAIDWGVDKALVSRVLVSSVHNTLARAAIAADKQAAAARYIEASLKTAMPSGSFELLFPTRLQHQKNLVQDELASREISQKRVRYNAIGSPNSIPKNIEAEAKNCLLQPDVHAAVQEAVANRMKTNEERFALYLALAKLFKANNDNLSAIDSLSRAKPFLGSVSADWKAELIRLYIALGRKAEASTLFVAEGLGAGDHFNLSSKELEILAGAVEELRLATENKQAHGQVLLLDYLKRHAQDLTAQLSRPVRVLEIGTTREDVPGQGSTKQFMQFCKAHSVDFTTVDMDPANSLRAQAMFDEAGIPFKAITAKGEEFLETADETFDCVFLDAYDFDHGMHSDLRQSRYETFLGDRISDAACHEMHLRCAVALTQKLPDHGLICFDDTWLDDGQWTAKGTTAMPYLLSNGFKLIDVRNRAALLARNLPQNEPAQT